MQLMDDLTITRIAIEARLRDTEHIIKGDGILPFVSCCCR
jgi:hypothetical protein